MKKIFIILKNKKKLFILLGIVIALSFYFGSKRLASNNKDNLFLIRKVTRGSINKIISGSGNVMTVDSFNIVVKKGGEIILLPFVEGEVVKKDTLLAQLDSRDIERQLKDTKSLLENQMNNLEKLRLSKINLENNLKKLENEYQDLKTNNDLRKNYENNINLLNSFYADIPEVLKNVENIFFNNDFKNSFLNNNLEYYLGYFNKNYLDESQHIRKDFDNLRDRLTSISSEFNKLNIKEGEVNFEIIKKSYDFISDFQNIIKNVLGSVGKIKEDISLKKAKHIYGDLIDSHFYSLKNYYESLNNYSQSLLMFINQVNSLENNLNQLLIDIENTKLNIKQSETDIKNLEVGVEQTKNKIADLESDLEDYKIYSPISGIIKSLNFKKEDFASPGAVLMTIVSADKIAEIKLNEVDIVDVKIGQQAILTFDALPGLKISGKVIQINPIGEISQGVVSYVVKIAFQEDNKEVKLGMTVNADIIVQSKDNTLIVPNQAIRVDQDRKYVEVPDEKDLSILNQKYSSLRDNRINWQSKQVEKLLNIDLKHLPQIKFVKTGLSDGTNIEILEGLEEGDWIIVKSRVNNQTFSTNQQQGLFQRFFPQPRRFIRSPGIRQ